MTHAISFVFLVPKNAKSSKESSSDDSDSSEEEKVKAKVKAVLNVTKYEDGVKDKVGINKDCTKGRKFVKDNSKALHTNKGKKKKTSLILDEDIENLGVKITKNPVVFLLLAPLL